MAVNENVMHDLCLCPGQDSETLSKRLWYGVQLDNSHT